MAEKSQLILTAIGADQIGLVEKISRYVSRCGCNIEDSTMAVFSGEFAVIILISGDRESLDELSRNYREIETETGLSITIKKPSMRKAPAPSQAYKLTASCMDHPGIVHHISAILSRLGVNIDSMETKTYPAPVSGAPLFQLEARLGAPARTDIAQLRERLAEFEREENIDIELIAIQAR